MAWPASAQNLNNGLAMVNATANKLRGRVQTLSAASAVGATSRQQYLDLQRSLDEAISTWVAVAALPGIVAYAREQFDNPAMDVAAEFAAMRNAAITLRDWINTNFPRDATTQAVLVYTYSSSGVPTELTFTTGQTAVFRTQASAFTTTIS